MNTPSQETAADSRYFGHRHLTVIEPTRGWRALDVRELWAFRELLWVLALRDVRVRYKQTVLGASWAILRPVLTMLVFTAVFGRFARVPSDGLPYPVFVYAGLLPWTFFAAAVAASGASLVGSANLVSKVYFPRLIVPLSSIGASLVDLFVSAGVLFALMAWYGVGWTPHLLAAPLLLVAVVFTALGVGTLLAALTVTYRDVTHLLPFLIQIWMFATPVIYPLSLIPDPYRGLMFLNPMTGLIEGFRSAFLGRPFDAMALAVSFAVALLFFAAGIAYFERVERRFADII
jgi:lipopolysaccharide transport system permease protein